MRGKAWLKPLVIALVVLAVLSASLAYSLDDEEMSFGTRELLEKKNKKDTRSPEQKALEHNNTPSKTVRNPNPRHYWPTWWNEEKEAKLMKDIRIGIIATEGMHHRIKYQRDTWWTDERKDMVEVHTDVSMDEKVPNVFNTQCDSTYWFGLWCKNQAMFRLWQTPRYREVKWFIRANDDSLYHLENAWEYLSTLDHTKQLVIGDKYCANYPADVAYPAGGCGFVVSQGFIRGLNWAVWDSPLITNLPVYRYYEDVLIGTYLKLMGDNVTIIHYPGIAQQALESWSGHAYYMKTWLGKPWPFDWKPIAYHQSGVWARMIDAFLILYQNDYYPVANITFEIPECKCLPRLHSRCLWNTAKRINDCNFMALPQKCLGPGPYTLAGHAALVAEKTGVPNTAAEEIPETQKVVETENVADANRNEIPQSKTTQNQEQTNKEEQMNKEEQTDGQDASEEAGHD